MSVSEIVKSFGGLTKMSRMANIPVSTIQSWEKTNKIPSWRVDAVIETAKKHSIDLPEEFLNNREKAE